MQKGSQLKEYVCNVIGDNTEVLLSLLFILYICVKLVYVELFQRIEKIVSS